MDDDKKKRNGVYYTPDILTNFLVDHIFSKYIKKDRPVSILEPSVGDGRFVASMLVNKSFIDNEISLTICDIDGGELQKAAQIVKKDSNEQSIALKEMHGDFLDYSFKEYDLIIGNPPYINKKFLNEDQKNKCKKIILEFIPTYGEVKNIWPAFLLKAANHLKNQGVLCFVLPAEILQVKYTSLIREYLLTNFSRIEIFAFNELIFPTIEQDVVVLIAQKTNDIKANKISFYQVERLKDLKIPDYTKKNSNVHRKKLKKWTNYILSDNELNFIEQLCKKYSFRPVESYCHKAEVGIVTAANNYFIISKEEAENRKLSEYVYPIIKRGSLVGKYLVLSSEDFRILEENNKPVCFINFKDTPLPSLTNEALEYIQIGEEKELHLRYKMKLRKYWYSVPSIWKSNLFFIKRSHIYPRIICNEANIYLTDSFYRIKLKEDFEATRFSFCFYNTLTFILAELNGRYYGGGVLELTPSEFKGVSIPYRGELRESQLLKLDSLFRSKQPISKILSYTDKYLFKGISSEELDKLNVIWLKLLSRRLKKSIIEI